ncbi:FCS-Like Zinc finger 8-like [Vicia villosa]|uniref:FCS-Like Zinc finger 8-like n=1 Tax=Vicia villosa TaxID=3911 RepID=UPI00273C73ED|nr:FCS-Like Zinc finger 8-like [Vicia villosa]
MLLRNRSRVVTKQTLMGEQSSPSQNFTTTIPSLFGSSNYRDFHFTSKKAESLISPTSILDTKALTQFENPFSRVDQYKGCSSRDKVDLNIIGLGLVGVLKDEPPFQQTSEKLRKKVVFGTDKLRVKIPPLPTSTFESKSDYGCKMNDSEKGVLSLSEMEVYEEYTCVISHGANPKTTHIFDNCVVGSYSSVPNSPHSFSLNFLSFCYTCKTHLQHTKDIFIYRGEKAFCSQECRNQEMMLDEEEN